MERFTQGSRDGARHCFRVFVVVAGLGCVGINQGATGRVFFRPLLLLPSPGPEEVRCHHGGASVRSDLRQDPPGEGRHHRHGRWAAGWVPGEAAHPSSALKYPHPSRPLNTPRFAWTEAASRRARERSLKPNFILGARRARSPLPGLRRGWCFKKRKRCPRTRNCDSYG